jgi:hypothetical protein
MVTLFLTQIIEAMMRFMPTEQLVDSSKYIVVAKVQSTSSTDKMMRWGEVEAMVVKSELKVIKLLKGSLSLKTPFVLNTFKFDSGMEDNVELPPVGSEVLLFLKKNEKGELKPVNGIQGVWPMNDGKPTGAGHGTTLEQIREMVQKQENNCKSEAFTSLVDTAEIQTQAGHYKEALEAYRKAYRICSMKDLEEQMAWLMGEVGDEDNNIVKERK